MKKTKVPKTIQQAKPAEIVCSIDDLLIEILLQLPVKSLIRFKIVSKHWHSLVTNPLFCRRRSNSKHNSAVGLLLPHSYHIGRFLFEYVPFFPKHSTTQPIKKLKITINGFGIRILQSCNGLLLCCSFDERYHVHNPTTNQYSTLPILDGATSKIRGVSLAFDPVKSPHYKVVCIRCDPKLYDRLQIVIYSSETGTWRISGEPFKSRASFEDGVYWNGAVHWIGFPLEEAYSLYFDIHQYVLEKMPNPPTHSRSAYYFGESGDHLHFFQFQSSQIDFNIYEMKRDYSKWFVKYHVDLSPVVAANTGFRCNYYYTTSIFCIVRGEEEADSFLVLKTDGKAIRYNLVSKTCEKLHEFEDPKLCDSVSFVDSLYGFQYVESLCCV